MTHFLQSEAWEQFQTALGRTSISKTGEGWSFRAYRESGTLNTRLYTPYGPSFKDEKALKSALSSLVDEGKKQGVTFVRIEPETPFSREIAHGFHVKPVTYQHLQPQDTQVIDLQCTPEALLASMNQNSRNITRNYHKKDISITTSHNPADIQYLLALLAKVASRTGLRTHSNEYLTKQANTLLPTHNATLYLAHHPDSTDPIAAALFFDNETTRYYAHAAANDDFRKLQPGTALLGQAILDAQKEGKTAVDLYGIAPEGAKDHPWAGFTRFKQSFGGSPLHYAGVYDIPLKPFQYWVYRTYQSLRKALR